MTVRYDDVRRKLAQDLRDLATLRKDDPDGVFDQELLCVLGVGPGRSDDFADPEDVFRLAYIVDRPTCRMVATDHEYEDSVRCTRCRESFARPWVPFRYCPNCDAEVVE